MSVYDSAFWIDAGKSTRYRIAKARSFKMKSHLHYLKLNYHNFIKTSKLLKDLKQFVNNLYTSNSIPVNFNHKSLKAMAA